MRPTYLALVLSPPFRSPVTTCAPGLSPRPATRPIQGSAPAGPAASAPTRLAAFALAGCVFVACLPVPALAVSHGHRPATARRAAGRTVADTDPDRQAGPGLFIPCDAATGLAVFRSGDTLVFVADRPLPHAARLTGWPQPADSALQSVVLDSATLFRLALPAPVQDVALSHDPDGWHVRVHLAGPHAFAGSSSPPPPPVSPQAAPSGSRSAPPLAEVALPGHVVFTGVGPGHVLDLPDPASGARLLVATSTGVTGAVPAARAAVGYSLRPSWQGVVVAADSEQITLRETSRGPDIQAVAMDPLPVGQALASHPGAQGQDRVWLGLDTPPPAGTGAASGTLDAARQDWLRAHAALLAAVTAPVRPPAQASKPAAKPTPVPPAPPDPATPQDDPQNTAPPPEDAPPTPSDAPSGETGADSAAPASPDAPADAPDASAGDDGGSVSFSQQNPGDAGATVQEDSPQPDAPAQDGPVAVTPPGQTGNAENADSRSAEGQTEDRQPEGTQTAGQQAPDGQVADRQAQDSHIQDGHAPDGQAKDGQATTGQAMDRRVTDGQGGTGQVDTPRATSGTTGADRAPSGVSSPALEPVPSWPVRITAAREALALGLVQESWLLLRDLPMPVPATPPLTPLPGRGGVRGGNTSWGADTPQSLALLRACAALLAGQTEAARPLADADIRLGPEWELWRALYQMQAGSDSTQTAILLARNLARLQAYPAPVRDLLAPRVAQYIARFGPQAARAVLFTLPDDGTFALAQGLLAWREGQEDTARAMFERLAGAETAATAAYARAALVGLMLGQDQISPAMAADAYAQLLGMPTGGRASHTAQAHPAARAGHGATPDMAGAGMGGGTGVAGPDAAIRLDYAQALVQAGKIPAAMAVLAGLTPGEQTPTDRIEAAWRAALYALVFGLGEQADKGGDTGRGGIAPPVGQSLPAPSAIQLDLVRENLPRLTDGPAKAKLLAGYGRQLLAAARDAGQEDGLETEQAPGANADTGHQTGHQTGPQSGRGAGKTPGPEANPALSRDGGQAAKLFAQAESLSAEPLMRADSAELVARAALDSGQVALARAALERGLLPDLPPDLAARRRYDEARLAAITGNTAGALLLLGEDESDAGLDLRARLHERAGQWAQAVLVLGRLCSRALPESGALTATQRGLALRLARDAVNANDPDTLRRLRGWVAGRVDLPRPVTLPAQPAGVARPTPAAVAGGATKGTP
ncbi:hypothetical protein K2X14_10320 [Acetobacter sp. TBRC 12305]|uniref:Uncharacterized protein n=1 Tax=Acetobacter garciniae TaxID=2817435 RepID=A0A939HQ58_9PROT|nr:hypothetical protein [Acetobacter garciniae]MBO1326028.1 hypothetical protein [Acetobacter garciniae]MBX0345228.1 hypothetical protein [Acetobacter garciniae]